VALKYRLLLSVGFLVFVSGCDAVHEAGSAAKSQSDDFVNAATVASFESTLYPLVTQNCAGCHGAGQPPEFIGADALETQEKLMDFNLVSIVEPSTSRIVIKILGGHQGFSEDLAIELEAAIQNWSDQVYVPEADEDVVSEETLAGV